VSANKANFLAQVNVNLGLTKNSGVVPDVSNCTASSVSSSLQNKGKSNEKCKISFSYKCSHQNLDTAHKAEINLDAADGTATAANSILGTQGFAYNAATDFSVSGMTTLFYQGSGLGSSASHLIGGLFLSFVAMLLAF